MLRLDIPQTCPADRSAMTAMERGRFCQQCQREVIDFTRMSDAQIRAYLGQHRGRLCGQLRPDQLNRPLGSKQPPKAHVWLLSLLTLGGMPVAAQNYAVPDTVQIDPSVDAKTSATERKRFAEDSITISGQILDEAGRPIEFATVILAGTDLGTYGSANGDFQLTVPTEKVSNLDAIELYVTSLGYHARQVFVPPGQKITLQLEASPGLLGEVVIVRTRWQAFWFRMGKPFRWLRRQW